MLNRYVCKYIFIPLRVGMDLFQIEGAKVAYSLSQTNAMRTYNTSFHTIPFPGCEHHAILSDEYWECQVSVKYSNIETCLLAFER